MATRLIFGLLPVLIFLVALIYLDTYKLIKFRWILTTILLGAPLAGASYLINVNLMSLLGVDLNTYARYLAPLVEEIAKGLFLVYLIRSNKVGFLVDTAIYGFALGTGFAVIENIYYLGLIDDPRPVVWIVRGCGTAIMHGGVTAVFGVASKSLSESNGFRKRIAYLPGLVVAYIIHSMYNHFFLTPLLSTVLILLALPPIIFVVFNRSEKRLENWLNVGFDADSEMLEMINSGQLSESKVGNYLHSLKERFRGEVVVDMLCYLRIYLELSLRAKGLLMMRESGFTIELDEETRAKFKELEFLEKSIGRTGKLAMAPFLRMNDKDLWQLFMLRK